MAIYGYVRRKQPLPTNDQLKIVTDYQCQDIFIEQVDYRYVSERQRMIRQLAPGDTVIVANLQVFGKTAHDIATVLAILRGQHIQLISWSTQLHLNYYKRTAGIL